MPETNGITLETLLREESEAAVKASFKALFLLEGKTLLITGATGLIGSALVRAVLCCNAGVERPVKLILPVRDPEKAQRLFGSAKNVTVIRADITQPVPVEGNVDYVIHGAGITASRAFVERPDEVLETLFMSTRSTLLLAKEKQAGYVLLSTMEVYGSPTDGKKITEKHGAEIDTMTARASYPEGKRAAEALVAAYAARYGLDAKAVRLTQTYGPGVDYDDARMFQSFARSAAEGKDIVLYTKGETMRSYLYTADAVSAILTVLVSGTAGRAYNAANEESYCSVLEMAKAVAARSKKGTSVRIEERDPETMGFAPTLRMDLDTSALRALGWQPAFGPEAMLDRLVWAAEQAFLEKQRSL